MTMPTFEPVAWYKQSEFDDSKRKSQSFNGWTKQYSDLNSGLFTAEQLQQAYEAGKRDAAPQVEQEPVARVTQGQYLNRLEWVSEKAQEESIVGTTLYAAPPAPAVPEWQPIETAPKYVDLQFFREDAGVFTGRITHCAEMMTTEEMEASGLDEDTLFQDDVFSYEWNGAFRCDGDLKPTLWAPLKASPSPEPTK